MKTKINKQKQVAKSSISGKMPFIVVLILISLLCHNALFSQAPLKQWDARFGGNSDDGLRSLQQTADGGYILGGYSLSGISGNKTQASQGFYDYWIVKIDANGVKQWDARFGGDSEDQLTSLQQTADGGYILGGYSNSGISGDKTQESQGSADYWIVKTDASGVKQWDARFGGSSSDLLFSLKQTANGGYILGGFSYSGISGDKTQANWDATNGTGDYWIVKTDANGVKQWDARFGGNGYDVFYSLQQTAEGGYILGGYSLSGMSGDKTQASQGGEDYWIVKTDANGVKQWDARFGGNGYDVFYSLQQTAEGGYILGGYSLSGMSGDKTQASQGGEDYWIVKTDANGVKQWDARFGGSGEDHFSSLEQTADGGYILGGESYSGISGDKTQANWHPFNITPDYWIVKTDANGVKQWDARFGGVVFEYFHSLQQIADGGYILGGSSRSGISGDKTQASQGGYDYWIVKVIADAVCSVPTNLSETNITSSSATLNWNAVSGAIKYKVRYRVSGTSQWTTKNSNPNSITITSLLPNTKYIWQVKTVCTTESSDWSEKENFKTLPLKIAASQEETFFDVYPNPFSSSATISFSLQHDARVQIELYDVAGKKVQTLLDENTTAGDHVLDLNRDQLNAGIYFLQLRVNEGEMMKKLIIQ